MNSARDAAEHVIPVIAHDAGAGEILAGYIAARGARKFVVYAAGPAASIFRRHRISVSPVKEDRRLIAHIVERHRYARYLLLGAPWWTRIERIAQSEARKRGLKTIVYLDSWVNYRERFGYPARGWKNNLPDEIWVSDRAAFSLARKLFPKGLKIRFVPNEYFLATKKRFKQLRKHPTSILFLSDPTRGSIDALEAALPVIGKRKTSLIIRFHLADDAKRYKKILERYSSVQISISKHRNIADDFASASAVFGAETVALGVAALCGLPVLCLAPRKKDILLPLGGIIRVRTKGDLARRLHTLA